MQRIEKTFEIGVPVRVAYNQWTQFEEFPQFMDGVKEVRQIDDTHQHWRASIGGKDKEWDAELTEQVPDQLIAWRSTTGTPNAGEVRFQPLGADRTRLQVALEYEPEGALEKAGDAVGLLSRRVEKTLEDFKTFVEKRGEATGAWRGEVHGGRPVSAGDPSSAALGAAATTGAPPTGERLSGTAAGGSPGARGGTTPPGAPGVSEAGASKPRRRK